MLTIEIGANQTLDCKGLACPMPLVRTRQMIDKLLPGEVLKIEATDRGSTADLKGWTNSTGHQYLGTLEEDGVLKHYVRKANPDEVKELMKYPHTMTNDELLSNMNNDLVIIDVREPAEYAFGHIPGAISIPLGQLEERAATLDAGAEIAIVCRTGNRSDMACNMLAAKGFTRLKNVIPGMSQWKGEVESS